MHEYNLLDPIPGLSGIECDKAGLSKIFGIPVAQLDGLVRAGCPCRRTGAKRSPLVFDSAQFHAWFVIRKVLNERGEKAARKMRLAIERDAIALAASHT